MESVHGVVKWYDPNKAYGFVSVPDGADVFVHRKGFAADQHREELIEGQEVALRIRSGPKGLEAFEVRVVKESHLPPRRRSQTQVDDFSEPPYRVFQGNRCDHSDFPPIQRDQKGRVIQPRFQGPLPTGSVAAEIVSIDQSLRFAFAKTTELAIDVYIHGQFLRNGLSQIQRGDRVYVELAPGDRGPRAIKVSMSKSQHWRGGLSE